MSYMASTRGGEGGYVGYGIPEPACERAYVINVAAYQHGLGYGQWVHIDGFSEAVLHWMREYEGQPGEPLAVQWANGEAEDEEEAGD